MTSIFYASPDHKRRWLTAMLATGKVWEGKLDPEYASALYILTASHGTWNKAESHVSGSGIRFDRIVRNHDFSSGMLALVRLAANLFNETNKEGLKARPIDIMLLDETNFTVALTALQIRRINWPLSELATEEERAAIEAEMRPPEDLEAEILHLLAQLPESYPEPDFQSNADGTYSLRIGYQGIFWDKPAHEALERVKRYVKERERNPTLPVGVIDGIYD